MGASSYDPGFERPLSTRDPPVGEEDPSGYPRAPVQGYNGGEASASWIAPKPRPRQLAHAGRKREAEMLYARVGVNGKLISYETDCCDPVIDRADQSSPSCPESRLVGRMD